ncbi:MAG: tRNA (cytidine(34)-2'-O)-methyltransferase [Gammaproteobacteria bacterium]|nr:tRNA (cytidine(34)-2'-O)-methyltransferase [Gammaproteobacteria bacterium]MBI5617854.1 tRNA (cytidine(34)-2'-O)-methyltransferase [Gammaproteobacteria bacterium]
MFDIALLEPEIPPNTGNIIRLCANTGTRLNLIEPLGYELSDKALKRAGLDYHDLTNVTVHASWEAFAAAFAGRHLFGFSTHGTTSVFAARFAPGDVLLFGSESRGLPPSVRETIAPGHLLRLPMVPGNRSLNLSNAAAVAVYEAWRQCGCTGAR